ncbi:hypothetical protein [Candidatus Nitrosotenuis cloacae]|uniref:hypothetical protein n=1 Tax=Candidatus Nitrosotenuis cloacae TaxID=1603555 RepID=UPI00130EF7B2|nr:hypothetical protein [Candidatus Nitrosotenuis cloacae]
MIQSDEKITKMRDPLFVIETSLEIIKQRSADDKIQPEIKRIESALTRLEQIMK